MEEIDIISMSPQQSYDLLRSDPKALLIDIRSSMEYLFVGHPIGSVHIAWIDEPEWIVNLDFPDQVVELAKTKDPQNPMNVPIVLICRSGKRTLDAGHMLLEEGFSNVIHIDEGFEGERDENNHRSTLGGWRFRGLPWEQC